MKFLLSEKDCLELRTVIDAKYKWDDTAKVTLYEGAQQIWYECVQFEGVYLHKSLTEDGEGNWYGHYHTEERSNRVQGEYLIGEDGFCLSDENVNGLLNKVEDYIGQ